MQDRTIGKIHFRGLTKNGLYPFPVSAYASPSFVTTSIAFLGVKTTTGTRHQCLGYPTGSTFQKLLVGLSFSSFVSAPC